jgi:hypothetical protein
MRSLMAVTAIGTPATAASDSSNAVRESAISSTLRQQRQLRQGCLISYVVHFWMGSTGTSTIRRLRKTLPTQPSLPFHSNIKRVRTAGCSQQPAVTTATSLAHSSSARPCRIDGGHPPSHHNTITRPRLGHTPHAAGYSMVRRQLCDGHCLLHWTDFDNVTSEVTPLHDSAPDAAGPHQKVRC